ncbi:MAG: hypothetical protein M1836_004153 [Candelina mexicana]|nr:MAG: hypothetical protein M1836_004153 [Candelina mexicana]
MTDIESFAETLNTAVKGVFPNKAKPTYRRVYVLLLYWEDDNLGCVEEVLELDHVFQHIYHFRTAIYSIPSEKSHNKLNSTIADFIDITGSLSGPSIDWFIIQPSLEKSDSDVLILLDCCHAASSVRGVSHGTTEIIAACGFETWSPFVGPYSFTRSLIDELRALSRRQSFSAAILHNKVLSRLKNLRSVDEKRKCPVHVLLTDENRMSIEIAPMPVDDQRMSPSAVTRAILQGSPGNSDDSASETTSSETSLSSSLPELMAQSPKVLISLALKEEQILNVEAFRDWLAKVPSLVNHAKVESVYRAHSMLVLLSMPVAFWDLLPNNPAYTFIGFIKSANASWEPDETNRYPLLRGFGRKTVHPWKHAPLPHGEDIDEAIRWRNKVKMSEPNDFEPMAEA